jgi:hypothetical protein
MPLMKIAGGMTVRRRLDDARTMAGRRRLLSLALLVLLLGMASWVGISRLIDSLALGCPSLNRLNIDAAVSDARKAIAKGDLRLLAVMGYTTEIPVNNSGLEMVERFNTAVKSNEVSVIEGTSDTPAGPQCAELNKRARRYAEIYNKEILSVSRP